MIAIKKGTKIVKTIPLNTEIIAYSEPMYFVITGSVVSIAVAPPEAIGASFPKHLSIKGVANKVITSLKILDKSAITPKTLPLSWVINMLDKL